MDAAQPRLTAFFGSKPKETPPAAGTSSSGGGGISATKRVKVEAGGVKGQVKLENEKVHEEQQDSLKTIPVRDESMYSEFWKHAPQLVVSRVNCLSSYYTFFFVPLGDCGTGV